LASRGGDGASGWGAQVDAPVRCLMRISIVRRGSTPSSMRTPTPPSMATAPQHRRKRLVGLALHPCTNLVIPGEALGSRDEAVVEQQ
jgi:hypothetical protein